MLISVFFRSSPAGTVTHDDILDITETLAEDGRYRLVKIDVEGTTDKKLNLDGLIYVYTLRGYSLCL